MAQREKTQFSGVYYITTITNDKEDKIYYIRYRDGNNQAREIKVGKHSEGVRANYCNQKRNEILTKQRLGEDLPAIAIKKKKHIITLDAAAEKFFKEREMQNKDNAHTQSKYNNWIAPVLGKMDIDLIGLEEVRGLQESLVKKEYAAATINFTINLLHAIVNYAIENKLSTSVHNPTKKLKQLKVDNARDRYLTKEECQRLLEAIEDEPVLRLFVRLSLSTGGRLETILSICKKDIDFSNKTIALKDHKNASSYRGFINDDLTSYVNKYCKDLKPNDKLITMPVRTLRRQLSNIFADLFNVDLDKNDRKNRVVIHTLRHTFASLLAIQGTPIFTIQKLMNHQDIKTTLRYAKLSPESGRMAVEGLEF